MLATIPCLTRCRARQTPTRLHGRLFASGVLATIALPASRFFTVRGDAVCERHVGDVRVRVHAARGHGGAGAVRNGDAAVGCRRPGVCLALWHDH